MFNGSSLISGTMTGGFSILAFDRDLQFSSQTHLNWSSVPFSICTKLDLLHSLLEDRVPSGLADNHISPLHNHNTGKEGRVARKLHNLPLFVGLENTK